MFACRGRCRSPSSRGIGIHQECYIGWWSRIRPHTVACAGLLGTTQACGSGFNVWSFFSWNCLGTWTRCVSWYGGIGSRPFQGARCRLWLRSAPYGSSPCEILRSSTREILRSSRVKYYAPLPVTIYASPSAAYYAAGPVFPNPHRRLATFLAIPRAIRVVGAIRAINDAPGLA